MIPSPSYYWSGLGASQKPSIFLTGASEVVETISELHLGTILAKASLEVSDSVTLPLPWIYISNLSTSQITTTYDLHQANL